MTAGCLRWPWCRAGEDAHRDGRHGAHLGRWQVGPVAVDVQLVQGDEHEPLVRVELANDDGRRRVLELDSGETSSVGDVLDMFAPQPRDGFSEAGNMVGWAGETIDPGHPRETPWQAL